jgi:hypothetical protein
MEACNCTDLGAAAVTSRRISRSALQTALASGEIFRLTDAWSGRFRKFLEATREQAEQLWSGSFEHARASEDSRASYSATRGVTAASPAPGDSPCTERERVGNHQDQEMNLLFVHADDTRKVMMQQGNH